MNRDELLANPPQPGENKPLKAGEWVEVRSREAILATLDANGCLDSMPLMPEMLEYCGHVFRVSKRADKTCDNIQAWSLRRVTDAVHLEGVRCNGSTHGDCQASCLIFWKEAWLKRVPTERVHIQGQKQGDAISIGGGARCTTETIYAAAQVTNDRGETVYSCQATKVRNFSSYMRVWDPGQYIRDLRSGNLLEGLANDSRGHRALEQLLAVTRLLHAFFITLFNEIQARRKGGVSYPFIAGSLEKTYVEKLDLQPGELVQVRSKEEIVATLDKHNRHRGLQFDSEMLPYCGGTFRVLRRVNRIIDEKTGKMLNMKHPCIVLEGAVCKSIYHRLCPRAIYSFWRENWLIRVSSAGVPAQSPEEHEAADCLQR